MTNRPLKELSNDELFDRLKNQQANKSWTVGEIFEIERRGFEILDRDPELRGEIETSRDKQIESIQESSEHLRNMLLPFQYSSLDTSLIIERMNESLGLPRNSRNYTSRPPAGFKVINSLETLIGPVTPEVLNLEINATETETSLVVAAFEETLKDVAAGIKKTNKLLRRDTVFWLIAFSTLISMIATVWMLVLSIRG